MGIKAIIHIVWNKLRLYFSFLLLVFYLVVGCLFLFSDIWICFLPKGKEIVGSALVLFGLFRFYVAYRRYKQKHMKIQELKQRNQKKKEPENELVK
jgi:amino acid permease